jgi:lysophospholipase L1-like esterase
MKQVNRKFLEEQVKQTIREIGDSAAAMGMSDKEHKKAFGPAVEGSRFGSLLKQILISIPFGSPESYADLGKWAEETGTYGIGPQKYYRKILDELGPLQNPNIRAPWGQLALRFVDTVPMGATAGKVDIRSLNLKWKEDLQQDLVRLRDVLTKAIYFHIKKGKDVEENILKAIRLVMYGERGWTDTPNKIVPDILELSKTKNKNLEELADNYGFTKGFTDAIFGEDIKVGFTTLFKQPEAFDDNGYYKEYSAKEFASLPPSINTIKNEVEKLIMFHFNGLENANFAQAYRRLMDKSELPRIARARAALEDFQEQGTKALVGAADIFLSVPTTVAFIASIATGVGVPAGAALAAGKGAAMSALRRATLKSATKMGKAAEVVLNAKKFGTSLKGMTSLRAQMAPLVLLFGQMGLEWVRSDDLEDANEQFIANYKDKTPQERIAFYESEVKEPYNRLATGHAKIYSAAGYDREFIVTRIMKPNYLRDLYANYDIEKIKQIQNNMEQMGAQAVEISKKLSQYEKEQGTLEASKQKLKEAEDRADAIVSSSSSIPLPKIIQQPVSGAPQDAEEPEPETKQEPEPETKQEPEPQAKQVSSSNIFFAGDSIAQGMRDSSKGSDGETYTGRTSKYVLDKLRARFQAKQLQEEQSNKTAIVSVGTNDALRAAGGESNFTPEKTAENIKQIVATLKQNGYTTVKVMPLIHHGVKNRTHTTYNGKKIPFNQEVHKNFVNSVNSQLSASKLELFDNNVELYNDGVHPKSPKQLLNKALGGSTVVSTAPVAPFSPKQVDAYNKDSEKPKQKFEGGVEKINAFFDRPVSDMNKIPRSQREAAVRKYFEITGASAKAGLPLEVLVKQMGAESGYVNKGFLGDTKSKYGPSYGIGQILRITGEALVKKSGQELIDYLNIASNNLDTAVKEHVVNTRYLSRNSWWNEASDTQKQLLILYAYNMGAGNSKLGVKGFMTRAGGDLEKGLSAMSAHYVKKYNYKMGYGHKIMAAAGKSVPTVDFDNVSVPAGGGQQQAQPAVAQQAQQTQGLTDTKSIEQKIENMKASTDLASFSKAYYDLLNMTLGSTVRQTTNMISAESQLQNSDISSFVKQRMEQLKTIHRSNFSKWKKEYEDDLKDPKKKDEADKKMAFYHRPIFYMTIMPSGLRNFFSDSPKISFGFEPGLKRVATSYGGNYTFYKQDVAGNQRFNLFLKELALLQKAIKTTSDKVNSLLSSNTGREEQLTDVQNYISRFENIVDEVSDGLKDPSNNASRKAYLTRILDLAMRTT